jgi:antitoxin ParD1/3/4
MSEEKRKAEEQIAAKLLEGLSNAETGLTPADWGDIRKEALAKVAATAATASMPKQAAVDRL